MGRKLTTAQYRKRTLIIKRFSTLCFLIIIILCCYFFFKNKSLNKTKPIAKLSSKKSNTTSEDFIDSNNYTQLNKENLFTETYTGDISNEKAPDTYNNIETNKINVSNSNNNSTISEVNPIITNLDEADSHFNFYKNNSQDVIDYNNEQIAKSKAQQEELNRIKETYEAKKQAIESWYQNEYNTNYSLMIEAQRNMNDAGGRYTDQAELNRKKIYLTSLKQNLSNQGLDISDNSEVRSLQAEYDAICNRYSYTKKYDEYYYYLYTTLPHLKTEKLAEIAAWYKQEVDNFGNK